MSKTERVLLRSKILGVVIRDARLAAGKTQDECAQFLGMSASRFSDVEYGERPLSLPELEAIAYLLEVPLAHLMGDQLLKANGQPKLPVEEILGLRHRTVGVQMRQARLAAGKTQAECADYLAVPESRISAYEYGQTPIPLPELELLANWLEAPLEAFQDQARGPLAKKQRQQQAWKQLHQLPEEVQAFVLDPLNVDYLRTAFRLSKISTDQLRGIAEALLEITY